MSSYRTWISGKTCQVRISSSRWCRLLPPRSAIRLIQKYLNVRVWVVPIRMSVDLLIEGREAVWAVKGIESS